MLLKEKVESERESMKGSVPSNWFSYPLVRLNSDITGKSTLRNEVSLLCYYCRFLSGFLFYLPNDNRLDQEGLSGFG